MESGQGRMSLKRSALKYNEQALAAERSEDCYMQLLTAEANMDYKMEVFPALEAGNPRIRFLFETAEQMVAAKDTAADLLLFLQDQAKVMPDYSNMFVLEEKQDGEWVEFGGS